MKITTLVAASAVLLGTQFGGSGTAFACTNMGSSCKSGDYACRGNADAAYTECTNEEFAAHLAREEAERQMQRHNQEAADEARRAAQQHEFNATSGSSY